MTNTEHPVVAGAGLILPTQSGYGIKHGTQATNDWGWRDIIGEVAPKTTGAGTPARALIQGNVGAYAFALNDVCDFVMHMPHDLVPGSHLFWHLHWLHNGTDITGTFEATNYASYAKGHNQANIPAEVAPLITYNTVDLATTPRYRHRIDEVQISASSPSATQIDSDDLEPDGILLVTAKVTQLPTVTGGSLFILFGDLHYQSTMGGTKNKAPNFFT